jgi:hypothetical protein
MAWFQSAGPGKTTTAIQWVLPRKGQIERERHMKLNGMMLVAGLVLAAGVSTARADVPWNNPNGSNAILSWQNGRSDNGLFGNNVSVIGDTFFFVTNNNFDAAVSEGATLSKSDTLRVTVHAQPGRFFTEVVFASQGDYYVYGDNSSVDVQGMLTINDLNSPRTVSDGFHTVVNPDPNSAGNATTMPVHGINADQYGNWTGSSVIDFSLFGFPPVTSLDLIFTNSIIAISAPGESASIITLPNSQGSFSLSIVPAPSAAGLLGLAGLGLVTRRRR